MQSNGKYYIKAIGKNDGVTYYYHSNKRFYWNIFHLASCSFKVWASKKYAEMAFDKIVNRNNRFDSISLMFCEYNKNESITIKSK